MKNLNINNCVVNGVVNEYGENAYLFVSNIKIPQEIISLIPEWDRKNYVNADGFRICKGMTCTALSGWLEKNKTIIDSFKNYVECYFVDSSTFWGINPVILEIDFKEAVDLLKDHGLYR